MLEKLFVKIKAKRGEKKFFEQVDKINFSRKSARAVFVESEILDKKGSRAISKYFANLKGLR